jgi:hypothetical protein
VFIQRLRQTRDGASNNGGLVGEISPAAKALSVRVALARLRAVRTCRDALARSPPKSPEINDPVEVDPVALASSAVSTIRMNAALRDANWASSRPIWATITRACSAETSGSYGELIAACAFVNHAGSGVVGCGATVIILQLYRVLVRI